MSQCGWSDCPAPIRGQVMEFIGAVEAIADAPLVGVYLYGSLALNCFNLEYSDIDLVVVFRNMLSIEGKRQIAEHLVERALNPSPMDVAILEEAHLIPWEHPTPYDLRYNQDRHTSIADELNDGRWQEWNTQSLWDASLAAELGMLVRRGMRLTGRPLAEVFPRVPRPDYVDSCLSALYTAQQRSAESVAMALNYVLNACRIYSFLLEGNLQSKDEGGAWAIQMLPPLHAELVEHALHIYRGDQSPAALEESAFAGFQVYIEEQISLLSR